jgi:type VI secretion system protein ImpA
MTDFAAQVDAWLEPLGDPPCGPDLEYDNSFLELIKAAEGKPETQFGPA